MAGKKKKAGGGGKKKNKNQQKQVVNRMVEDKTFGLKNKNKSKKVQRYVDQVQKQAELRAYGKKKNKKEVETSNRDLNVLNPLIGGVKKGVDPKSQLCPFFKIGACTKGSKCKYSHDKAISRKVEKIDIYTDRREVEEEELNDWDQSELEDAVKKKHSGQRCKTTIICKHFIEAVETRRYGWFWECPNGGEKCQYVHALPPDYVLKRDKRKKEKLEEQESLEEKLEKQRAQIKTTTPLTLELFLQWKEKKRLKRLAEEEERKEKIKSGKIKMSGRELFESDANLFVDDESAAGFSDYKREDDIIEGNIITATATSITRISVGEDSNKSKVVIADGIVLIEGIQITVDLFQEELVYVPGVDPEPSQ
eukprot:TRINITY_DN626_c0_g2_i1.p1 TRINITY_DN626_c0_g2~~TRINITY_DN626_c0_g2_i1.p1  ORF type:complete len:365 (-),score=160.89 TRINITY_DN626_c0_g2_i1:202-1296(-)